VISLEQALRERALLLNTCTADRTWPGDYDAMRPLKHPEQVLDWTRQLIGAGADIVEAYSLGAGVLEYGNEHIDPNRLAELNRESARIARQAAAGQKYVVGVVGESVSLLTVFPRNSFEEHVAASRDQVRALWAGGVDAIHLVHFNDARNIEAALAGIDGVQQELGCRIPAMVTLDLPFGGALLSNHRPDQLWSIIEAYRPIALGIASYGRGVEDLRQLREVSGLPIGWILDPCHGESASWAAEILKPLLEERLLNYCGIGCTVPSLDYVTAIADLLRWD
jgi:methionine synthase I (cobalamin-dependent)